MMDYFGPDIDISSITAHLKSFSNEELEAIVNDSANDRIDSLVKDLPQIKNLEQERERLIEENKKMAENNLSFESTYRVSRQKLAKALEETQEMKSELDKKKHRLREFTRQHSLDTTLALMQAAMAEAEEESDKVASSFLRKQISIDEFLEDFNQKRKLYHSRRIKAEKMPEEINKIPSRPAPPIPGGYPQPSLPFSSLSIGSDSANGNSGNNQPPYPTRQFFPTPYNYQ